MAIVLCSTAFVMSASAGGGDGELYYTYTETAKPEMMEEPQEETTEGHGTGGAAPDPEGQRYTDRRFLR